MQGPKEMTTSLPSYYQDPVVKDDNSNITDFVKQLDGELKKMLRMGVSIILRGCLRTLVGHPASLPWLWL